MASFLSILESDFVFGGVQAINNTLRSLIYARAYFLVRSCEGFGLELRRAALFHTIGT
jgi:hypothetical protein